MIVPKSHPVSMCPMGFRISPSLQQHMFRLCSKLVFSEASEELWQFLEIDVSDKQVERVCHCYGEKLDELDWINANSDSIQLKLSHQEEDLIYAMVDGSMLSYEYIKRVVIGEKLWIASKMRNAGIKKPLREDFVVHP